jgi:DNA polymerase III delta prime subunit
MLRIADGVHRALVESGLRRKELERKRKNLEDARKLIRSILAESEKTHNQLDWVNALGMMAWSISLVCDVLIDSVARGPEGKGPQMALIRQVYDQGTKNKFEGNRFEDEAKKIEQARDLLKKRLPPGSRFLADVLANLARNTTGMIGYALDASDTTGTTRRAVEQGRRDLRRLNEAIERIDRQLEALRSEPSGPAGGLRLH